MSQVDYCRYYRSQRGGEIPVFRGGLQGGAGLGDIIRNVLRFMLPVALRGIHTFASRTLAGSDAGLPLGAAAKAAITPSLSAAAGGIMPTIRQMMAERSAQANPSGNRQAGGGVLFDGENGIPLHDRPVKSSKRTYPWQMPGDMGPKRKAKKKKGAEAIHYNF